ncbi:hypothetical protein H4J45_13310 [Colwellia sp. BRX10-6]|uniref:hypothetical protein n=1 Tax=unclassified Colwellia TaxID=196834 RepID=UPI0015F74FE3|nr:MULTISPECIES: hypothetical protein [unclassified Colwellia]MBA6384649.1 hypothetical protein [Colwellia sp. BRX10-9]MBA6395067.1 hypothetical protein [Colwellia sp. BRX10-6]
MAHTLVDIPFEQRHQCWFCGEPSELIFGFPHQYFLVFDCSHPPLSVPSCRECTSLARKAKQHSIWAVANNVKHFLAQTYQKDLAIGINWTKEELADSEFESGNFVGFQKSAWMMYEIAKQRLNYQGWLLSLEGVELDVDYIGTEFTFDGVTYPSVDLAIEHFIETYDLSAENFKKALSIVGIDKFGKAVRFCRLLIGRTPEQQKLALRYFAEDEKLS